ncbi:MAG: lactonase family protein [Verrucomicrobiota bacterium]
MNIIDGAVFVQTNDADSNQVIVFGRGEDGALTSIASYETGGRGTGSPHLPSQGSVVAVGGRVLVANTGSNDLSVFEIGQSGLELLDRAPAGRAPRSVAVRGDLVYVLGSDGITGLRSSTEGGVTPIEGSARALSTAEADGAQVSFTPDGKSIVVTERVTDKISVYTVGSDGLLQGPAVTPSSGATPYGFDFTADGTLVVTEAFGGEVGAAAASSYRLNGTLAPVSPSVKNSRSEVCWAAVSKDGRFAYVTNFGDNTISSYTVGDDGSIGLLDPVAASTRRGAKGIRDEAVTGDGRYLYALDADAGAIHGWIIGADGSLAPVAAVEGLPPTAAGLAVL